MPDHAASPVLKGTCSEIAVETNRLDDACIVWGHPLSALTRLFRPTNLRPLVAAICCGRNLGLGGGKCSGALL